MKLAPVPAYARHMTTKEIIQVEPTYFVMRWEFYAALASFVLFTAYFPWGWIADWAVVKALVLVMERVVPAIAGLVPEARHLPVAASKAQLSFLHLSCGVLFLYKLAVQPPAVWGEQSAWRWIAGIIAGLVVDFFFIYALFFFNGKFNNGFENAYHTSRLAVVSTHVFIWLCFLFITMLVWSFVQELRRIVRNTRNCG